MMFYVDVDVGVGDDVDSYVDVYAAVDDGGDVDVDIGADVDVDIGVDVGDAVDVDG